MKMEHLKIVKILFKHKSKYFLNNSYEIRKIAKIKNENIFGIYLIFKFFLTELIFLKEKNKSAKEQNYWQINFKPKKESPIVHYKNKYKFEFMDAFSPNINMWKKFILKNKLHKKELNYLEIGVFEGRSSVFILENLPYSKCDFVDPFQEYSELTKSTGQKEFSKIYDNFINNIEGFKDRAKVHRMTSDTFFKNNSISFDLIYIDGSHYGPDVYKDSVNSFKILNQKGHIIFDDFLWFFFKKIEENPLGGIFEFLIKNKKDVKIKYVGTQLIIQKK